ncbi:reverse transcriptase [Cucumis melo var. makuwa]|uniref:Reverse transcriptase n=1 Tax=Cucumis melo var. makuwa TaxID=1194695 RepID=A0A5A7TG08_CUCMM|nr:reverse transcriptase [Cucumis melo var. makuwa]TYK23465.1 reverse transcriptase [Cucumis melo var. makuwa]
MSESVGTSLPSGPTANQNGPSPSSTLEVIAQSGMPQSLNLISVNGKNLWILGLSATDHFIDLSLGRMIFIAQHTRGLYLLDDDTSVFLIIDKSEVSSVFQNFYHIVEMQLNAKIAILWSDNARVSKPYPWRNLTTEIEFSTDLLTLVQDSEPPRDEVMTNPIYSRVDSKMSENDRSNIVVPEDMGEKDNVDETEVIAETGGNEVEQDHLGNLDEYDPSLDISIVLRKGTKSCTEHPICNYVFYESISTQFKAFIAGLDSIVIPKNIHISLECVEWKTAVMKDMRALERIRLGRFVLSLRDIELWDVNGRSHSNTKQMELLTGTRPS